MGKIHADVMEQPQRYVICMKLNETLFSHFDLCPVSNPYIRTHICFWSIHHFVNAFSTADHLSPEKDQFGLRYTIRDGGSTALFILFKLLYTAETVTCMPVYML